MINTIAHDINRHIERLLAIKAKLTPRHAPLDRDCHLANHADAVSDAGRVREACDDFLIAVAHSVLHEVGEVPGAYDTGRFRDGSHDAFNDLTFVDLDTVLNDMEAA